VAVVERAGGEQYERDQTGRGAAEAAANSPGRNQSNDANRSPDESPGLEKTERKHFGGEPSRHVKAAAIFVEIDEGQRALIAKTRTVKREQQVAILRMGVVVPSKAVVAERQCRNGCDTREHDNSKTVGSDGCRPCARKAK